MREYDIKRGHWKNVEGEKLTDLMRDHFGEVQVKDGVNIVEGWNAFERLTAEYVDKTTLRVDTDMNLEASNEEAQATIRTFNDFLKEATGFTAKKRRARAKEKAKEGEL